MYLLIKDSLVVESSTLPIVAAQDGDYFASQTRHHYDPRPSSGVVVIEADFPEESFCTYQMVDGKPVLISPDREQRKAQREIAVSAITVTTAAGNTFDGDETSQGRMARAIIALSTGLAPSIIWVLADNSVIQATAAELTEALVLAGQAQAAIWVL